MGKNERCASKMEGKINGFKAPTGCQEVTEIVECLEIIDVGCTLKQFDGLTWLTPKWFYDRSTPLHVASILVTESRLSKSAPYGVNTRGYRLDKRPPPAPTTSGRCLPCARAASWDGLVPGRADSAMVAHRVSTGNWKTYGAIIRQCQDSAPPSAVGDITGAARLHWRGAVLDSSITVQDDFCRFRCLTFCMSPLTRV